MAMNWTIELDNGQLWAVGSGVLFGRRFPTRAQVIVPIENLGDMTNEEIGKFVREAVPMARQCLATEIARDIIQFPDHYVGRIDEEDMQLLQEHAHLDEEIQKAVDLERAGPQPRQRIPPQPPKKRAGYIYLVRSGDDYKIGLSNRPDVRMSQLGLHLPRPFELLHTIPTSDMVWAEQQLHQKFAAKRLHGEWFSLSAEDVAWICTLTQLEKEPDHE